MAVYKIDRLGHIHHYMPVSCQSNNKNKISSTIKHAYNEVPWTGDFASL